MTARKKEHSETGTETNPFKNPTIQYFLGTGGFRLVILVLVFSMHPAGRQLLGTFGFEFPDQRKATQVVEEAKNLRLDVNALQEVVKELKENSTNNKANNAIVNSKIDGLEHAISGFQIDFNKWKTKLEQP